MITITLKDEVDILLIKAIYAILKMLPKDSYSIKVDFSKNNYSKEFKDEILKKVAECKKNKKPNAEF